MEQYIDYIKRQHDRAERIKQQFPDQLIESPKQPLWMHTGIDRYESPKELTYLGIVSVVAALIILGVVIYSA